MIAETQFQEPQFVFPLDTKARRVPERYIAGMRVSSELKRVSKAKKEQLHPEGVGRLYLAIVNRAVLDVLENGEEARSAERWLMSKDFDRLQGLFG
jgi:hypothetical protein